MQTYKAFMKILWKNIPAAMIYFGIFMIITIIATMQGTNNAKNMYKDTQVEFAVIDRDNSIISEGIKAFLSLNNEYVELEDSEKRIETALFNREIYYALIIPEGFGESVINGGDIKLKNIKVPDSAAGYFFDMKAENYVNAIKTYLVAGISVEEAVEKTMEALKSEVSVELAENLVETDGSIKGRMAGEAPTYYYYYTYVPYIFISMIMCVVCPVLLAFNKKYLKMRINVSAQTLKSNAMQMALGVITFGALIYVLFNLIALILYGKTMTLAAMLCYLLLTFSFVMVCLAISYMAGMAFEKNEVVSAFSNVIAMGLSFVGGVFVPLELLGSTMKNIALFTPTYWFVRANDVIMDVRSFGDINISEFAKACGIQLLYAAAFFCMGLVILKRKREID